MLPHKEDEKYLWNFKGTLTFAPLDQSFNNSFNDILVGQ